MKHPRLMQEKRARMKIFFLEEPLPAAGLDILLRQALLLAGWKTAVAANQDHPEN